MLINIWNTPANKPETAIKGIELLPDANSGVVIVTNKGVERKDKPKVAGIAAYKKYLRDLLM